MPEVNDKPDEDQDDEVREVSAATRKLLNSFTDIPHPDVDMAYLEADVEEEMIYIKLPETSRETGDPAGLLKKGKQGLIYTGLLWPEKIRRGDQGKRIPAFPS